MWVLCNNSACLLQVQNMLYFGDVHRRGGGGGGGCDNVILFIPVQNMFWKKESKWLVSFEGGMHGAWVQSTWVAC